MSVQLSRIAAIAMVSAGLVSAAAAPAWAAHRYQMDSSYFGSGCPSWERPQAQRSWNCTLSSDNYSDGGLGFRLFWTPPLSDRERNGDVSPMP